MANKVPLPAGGFVVPDHPVLAGTAFLTAASISSADGRVSPLLATVRPSTVTVNSPWSPLTTSTSTPGSFFKDAATLAACARTEPQTGHWRITTFVIAVPPLIE